MKLFRYTGQNPTNVSFHGVSFPVVQGDILKSTLSFLATQIPEKQLRAVEKGSPRHVFDTRRQFGGPTGSHMPTITYKKSGMAKPFGGATPASPGLLETTEEAVNPYDLGVDIVPEEDKVLAETDPEKFEEEQVKARQEAEEVEETEEAEEVEETEDSEDNEDEEKTVEEAPVTRSQIRAMNKEDLDVHMRQIIAGGCTFNPEMKETLETVAADEEATKGNLFAAVWEYYRF